MPATLRIQLFGTLRIRHDGSPDEVKLTRRLQALLSYLLIHRSRSHPRELLAGLFWQDQEESRARSCLSTVLWRLRHALEPAGIPHGTYLVVTPSDEIAFNTASQFTLDIASFEDQAIRTLARPVDALDSGEVQALESTMQLVGGELLEGFYEDWVLRERERLRRLHLNCLTHLMTYHKERGALEASVACGERILQYDPLREEIHRALIRSYMASGNRARALRQYEYCRELLAAELGVPPMEETQGLLAQIMTQVDLDKGYAQPATSTALLEAMHQLQLAWRGLDKTRAQLSQVMQLVERSIGNRDVGST